jgi:hypothetical protein
MNIGWVRINRSLTDSGFWLSEPFTKSQAWVDLFVNANHKDGTIWLVGTEIKVKRGQIAWSEVTMSKRWKWSRNKVRRFLKWLSDDGKTIQQTIQQRTTILTLVNYEKWQSDNTTDNTAPNTALKQPTIHKQECKEVKNILSKDNGVAHPRVQELIDSFKKTHGFTPTDPKPRNEAWNLWRKLKKLTEKTGMIDRQQTIIASYSRWIASQDWSEGVQKMGTWRLKYPIYESEIIKKYPLVERKV